MAKTKEQKKEILKKLEEKIERAKSIIFTRFDGLGVSENQDLRKKLKTEESEYFVVKKTLLNLAFKDRKYKDLNIKDLEGRLAVVFGYGDEVAPAKIVHEFKKEKEEKIDFCGGILDGKFITTEEVNALAKIPSKDELYAKLVGSINAPVSGFVNVLSGNLRNLVYVLKAIEEKR